MQLDRMTTKSQQAVRAALDVASRKGNPEIVPEHMLVAVLEQRDGVGGPLAERTGANVRALIGDLNARIDSLPKVSGGAEPSFGRRAVQLIQRAQDEAKKLKDDYISVEHLVLAATRGDGTTEAILHKHGLNYDNLLKALAQIRGSHRVTDQDPEGKFQALEKYARDLTALAKQGKIDPVIGRDEEIRPGSS